MASARGEGVSRKIRKLKAPSLIRLPPGQATPMPVAAELDRPIDFLRGLPAEPEPDRLTWGRLRRSRCIRSRRIQRRLDPSRPGQRVSFLGARLIIVRHPEQSQPRGLSFNRLSHTSETRRFLAKKLRGHCKSFQDWGIP